MTDIYGVEFEELTSCLVKHNQKPFKAGQVFDWLYKKRVTSFEDMTNVGKECIQILKEEYIIGDLVILKKQLGKDVYKYLFKLHDDETIEAVLMFHDYGTSLCVSTQVGCNMGCAFCESGRLKKIRNLTANEMVLQILKIEQDIDRRISHIVLMGIGEPFDNYEEVMKFIKIITNNKGIDLGSRHITVSTCGIIPKIEEFGNQKLQVNLAISLHAPNDEIRSKIMPINKVYKIGYLINSVKDYIKKTNRRVTFEYIMLDGINDSDDCASQLVSLLKGINCYVNLIPYNETNNIQFKKSNNTKIMHFYDILKKNNINVTVRREFGSEVDAACGQLRATN
ncbi:MAG: 23S rRNA (adenine(2503)-C(2))-methyltransferase RlmN [Bacilli bacterium]|nr:23S rRNA (adenine(2503)-C(2))-methyltransferase RlmN [Bacilli bacterium]MDD4298308.1 23S rRNA (adenine(2503)-C(2))-methyltransferase RlmN [Bacilli bacterium]